MGVPEISRSSRREEGLSQAVVAWLLLHGDRRLVAGFIVLGIVVVIGTLATTGIISVGPDGYAGTLFASGLTAGLVTLLTLALSINQLILSRLFGSPDELADRLAGTRELRSTVERLAGVPSSPTDPAAFLSLLAGTLRERANALETSLATLDWEESSEVTTTVRAVARYADGIEQRLSAEASIVEVLEVILGTEYAEHLVAIQHLQQAYATSLPEDVQTEVHALDELLESLAITRQFFKTLALQQDFARLSRLIIFSGLFALGIAIALTLVYRTDAVTVPVALLPVIVSLGIGSILAPLAAFVAYLSRAATIAHRTVSVGPFVPPHE